MVIASVWFSSLEMKVKKTTILPFAKSEWMAVVITHTFPQSSSQTTPFSLFHHLLLLLLHSSPVSNSQQHQWRLFNLWPPLLPRLLLISFIPLPPNPNSLTLSTAAPSPHSTAALFPSPPPNATHSLAALTDNVHGTPSSWFCPRFSSSRARTSRQSRMCGWRNPETEPMEWRFLGSSSRQCSIHRRRLGISPASIWLMKKGWFNRLMWMRSS